MDTDFSKLEKLQRDREKAELFTDSFIRKHTEFPTFQAMVEAGGVKENEEAPGEEFSAFIATHSQFNGWRDMFETAGSEWLIRQLRF